MPDKSMELWVLIHDLDNAIDEYSEGDLAKMRKELLKLQRRQVRILLEIHAPDEVPTTWKD